jgi:hypothetical protein
VIVLFCLYHKFNQLDMDDDATRTESEQNCHDTYYLCDMGANFHDLSSNNDDS